MKIFLFLIICLIVESTVIVYGQNSTITDQPFRVGLKWGIKDSLGKILLNPRYEYIMKPNSTNLFGVFSTDQVKMFLRYDTINNYYKDSSEYRCFIYQNENDNYDEDTLVYLFKPALFLIDKTGKRVTVESFDNIVTYDSSYLCIKSNKYYVIGIDGKTKGPWDYCYDLHKNLWDSESPDFYLVNLNGEEKKYSQVDTVIFEDIETGEWLNKMVGLDVPYRQGGLFSILNKSGDRIINQDFEDLKISTARKNSDSYGDEIAYNPLQSVSDSMTWKYFSNKIDVNRFMFGKVKGKWGVIHWSGDILIPFEYDSLEILSFNSEYLVKGFKEGKYILVYPGKNASIGFDNLIELQNESFQPVYYILQNGGEKVNILTRRDTVQLMRWETEEFYEVVQESYTSCFKGGKFQILNNKLEQIAKDEYDSLQFFIKEIIDGVAEKIILRNFSDTLLKSESYEVYPEKPILTFKNGLWGAITPSGYEIFNNKYHSLKLVNYTGNDQLEVTCDGYIGIVSLEGKEIFEPKYCGFIFPDLFQPEINVPKSHVFFYQNRKMGVIDLNGEEIISALYDSIYAYKDFYIVAKGGSKKRLNYYTLETVFDPYSGVEQIAYIVNNKSYIIDAKWGILDSVGKIAVSVKYDRIVIPSVSNDYNISKLFIFSTGGKNKLAEVNNTDTVIEVNSYYDFKLFFPDLEKRTSCYSMQNPYIEEKYGLVDRSGNELITQCDTIDIVDFTLSGMIGSKYFNNYLTIKDKEIRLFDLSGKEVEIEEGMRREIITRYNDLYTK